MKVQNYLLTEEIGSGSFSTVYKAQDINDSNKVYAIKSMRDIPQNDLKVVLNEIQLLKNIKHKNVVNCVDNFEEKGKWYIVFEYCGKGDLQNYFKKNGRLTEVLCKNLAASVIEALSQIHQKNIAHRDLKLSNILINDQYDFKIADFGMAKIQKDGILQSYCGTPYAMAPQVLKRQQYDTKCDTWSLGIMLYQLIFGKLPFDSRKHGGGIYGLTLSVLQEEPNYNLSGIKVSDDCLHFIKLCLRKDPKDRPTMKALSAHPWLSSGVGSLIRRNLFQGGNSKEINQQAIKRAKQIFNEAVQQHVKKLVKQYRLSDTQTANFIGIFDKYYKQETDMKAMMLLMITKIIRQLNEKPTIIEIQDKKFSVDLMKVKSYKNHIQNLRELLSSLLSKLALKQQTNIQRQIISFVINKAESCLNLTENLPDKVSLLRFLSKLPINIPESSVIKIKWSFNEQSLKLQQMFNQYLEKISEQQIYKFINQNASSEVKEKNWIIEHEFPKQKRAGNQISIGEFISKVIDINCSTAE